jgi:hypothetical protein
MRILFAGFVAPPLAAVPAFAEQRAWQRQRSDEPERVLRGRVGPVLRREPGR